MIMTSNNNYHFKVGGFDCTIVSDGTFAYPHPAQLFFANAPHEPLQQALEGHNVVFEEWEVYVSPYPSLVINTGQQLVLVDTGAGGFAPTTGKLVSNLQLEGIAPEDIDIVVLTHGHPDHIGGTLDKSGQPAFPKARYVIGREEWDFWASEPDLSHLQIPDELKGLILQMARTNLPPLQDQLQLVEVETEILAGIRVVAAPGHTPGHIALSVTSGDEQLLVVGDAIIHPLHLEFPDWYTGFDYAPEQVVATRHRLLKRAAAEKALLFAYHFATPSLGYVAPQGQAWQWQPLEIKLPVGQ
jgi:glyoxylase-like metal-dependent hydrolase (beta-lactamase superfamily II)